MNMTARCLLVLPLVSLVVFGGCHDKPDKAKKLTKLNFQFEFHYRKDTTVPHSDTKKLEFEVELKDGPVPEIAVDFGSKKADVGEFQVILTPAINSFFVDVFEKGEKPKHVLRQLYQFGSKVQNQFDGQHGFTGLVYVNHSKTDAELQYFGKCIR